MTDKPRKSHVLVSDPVTMPPDQPQPAVTTVQEPAQTPDPEKLPPDAVLSHGRITECAGPDACGLEFNAWSGRDRWRCDKCGFVTFEKDEALGRKPSLAS